MGILQLMRTQVILQVLFLRLIWYVREALIQKVLINLGIAHVIRIFRAIF